MNECLKEKFFKGDYREDGHYSPKGGGGGEIDGLDARRGCWGSVTSQINFRPFLSYPINF